MAHSPTPADHHAAAQSLLQDAMEQRRLGRPAQSAETARFAQVHALLAISGQMLAGTAEDAS
jgi:hypothetical protein